MHFFIQGEPLLGKSYLLQHGIAVHALNIIGYTPQRLYDGADIVAYRAELISKNKPSLALDGLYDPRKHNIFLDMKTRHKSISVLEDLIVQVSKAAAVLKPDLIMLDEVGGFEMESDQFASHLLALLDSFPCIGVIKHHSRSMNHTQVRQAQTNYQLLTNKIEQGGHIYTMNRTNSQELAQKFEHFLHALENIDR